ncbi:MafI family immunity protein [Pseudomonas sp. PDM11]|nr:MafI family immunity protein [Pseudomonas sp. PDM11]
MHCYPDQLEADVQAAIHEISALVADAYRAGRPVADSHPLAQAGLADGRDVVLDYLEHNEAGLAYDHLMYMVVEADLKLSEKCKSAISRIASYLEVPAPFDVND